MTRKVKPTCRFYKKERTAYALLRGIVYIYDERPFSVGLQSACWQPATSPRECSFCRTIAKAARV